MSELLKEKNICYCFGGSTWPFRDDEGDFCYLTEFGLKAKTDGNTCDELGGDLTQGKNGYYICKIPLKNIKKLRPRKHPKYSNNHLEQKTYEFLIEEGQESQLIKEFLEKKEPGRYDKSLDKLTKIPFASVHKIKDIKDEKVKTEKIQDLTLSKKGAKRLIESMDTFLIEDAVKGRLSAQFYGVFYHDLPSNEKAKLRYRINKFTKDFKI